MFYCADVLFQVNGTSAQCRVAVKQTARVAHRVAQSLVCVNPLMGTSNCSATSNKVDILTVDWRIVTFGTAKRGLGGNNPPINGQCTNHRIAVQWSVALRL